MTPEEEAYYNNYFDLFLTDGWKQLVEEITNNAKNINSVESTADVNDLFFRKGQLNTVSSIVNLPAFIEQGFNEANSSSTDTV